MFPYDFRDERMMQQLKTISQRVLHVFPELRAEMGVITHNLLNKVSQSFRKSVDWSVINWSVGRVVGRSVSQLVRRSVEWFIIQSVIYLVSQSLSQSVSHSLNLINRSINPISHSVKSIGKQNTN